MNDQDKNLPAPRPEAAPAQTGQQRPGNSPSVVKMQDNTFTYVPQNFREAMQFAEMVAKSSLCPEAFRGKAGDVMIAWQMGGELGISMLQALRGICVINGRPSVWGETALALIRRSHLCEYLIQEWDEASLTATVRGKRRGQPNEEIKRFSWKDAIRAKLSDKATYRQYPQDMLTWKATHRLIKDLWPDLLNGMELVEEARDLPDVSQVSMPTPLPMPTVRQTSELDQIGAAMPPPPPPKAPASSQEQQGTQEGAPGAAETTPEEDLTVAGPEDGAQDDSQQALPGTEDDGKLRVVSAEHRRDGVAESTGKPWRMWAIHLSDGRTVVTFSEKEFIEVQGYASTRTPVIIETKPWKDEKGVSHDRVKVISPAE